MQNERDALQKKLGEVEKELEGEKAKPTMATATATSVPVPGESSAGEVELKGTVEGLLREKEDWNNVSRLFRPRYCVFGGMRIPLWGWAVR